MRSRKRREVTGARYSSRQAAVGVGEVLNAIRLGEELSAVEGVKEDLRGGGLVAADEVPGQADAGDGKPQPPRQQDIEQAEVDGVAGPPVQDTVQVAVFRVVVVFFVAGEAEFAEEVLVDGGQDCLRFGAGIQPAAEFVGVAVEHRLVGFDVDERVLGLREQPGALFEVEFLAVAEAEGEEMVVGGLAVEVEDDLPGAAAQRGVVAHGVRPQPFGGRRAAGEKLLPHRPVDGRVLVRQQTEQGAAAAFWRRAPLPYKWNRARQIHTLTLHSLSSNQ